MAAQSFYSMKWENYLHHVSDLFNQLLETGSMSDITLYAEGTKINCHKILLSACSPYFQEILSDVNSEKTAIVISGIEGEDVKSCIEFIYKGEISVKAERLCSVLKAAQVLKICGLTDVRCETTNDTSSPAGGAQVTVNNQSEKEGGAKLVLKCKSPEAQPKSKNDTTNLKDKDKDKDNLEVAEDGGSEDDTEIIVLPDHMMLEEGGESGLESMNEKRTKIANESSEIEHSYTIEEYTDDEAKEVSCDGVKVRKARKRVLKRKDTRKRSYSEAAMQAAIEDMRAGKNLVKSAQKHCVPKTTLYCRARRIGACHRIHRKGYPTEQMNGALEAVANGSSLQYASTQFGIPKTVLWRRVKKEFEERNMAEIEKFCSDLITPTAVKVDHPDANTSVEDSVSIRRVSPQYQIPKATLFRWEKVEKLNKKDLASSSSTLSADEEIKCELLPVENEQGIVEVASSCNEEQSNTDLQVNYLESAEFSNSSIIILESATVEQNNEMIIP